jgi:glycosyltransferase involved in cell wall biosynthesis
VRFIQGVDDATLRWLYAQASVLIAPSFEDYGLTPLEAASMGTPTVALRAGGYLDTIIGGETGIFFDSIDPVDIINALDQAAPFELDPSVLRGHAARFSRERFASRMQAVINEVAP